MQAAGRWTAPFVSRALSGGGHDRVHHNHRLRRPARVHRRNYGDAAMSEALLEGDSIQFLEFTYKNEYLQAVFFIRECKMRFYLNKHATERRHARLVEDGLPHEVTDYVLSAWPPE